jgi:ketosteroid isomerase-like protein
VGAVATRQRGDLVAVPGMEDAMASPQTEVSASLDSWSEAIRSKDIDRLMSLYSPDIVYFDVVPPLQFGGEVQRDVDTSPERLDALERFFRGGEADLEVIETYTSGDLVVLVAIERQRGEVVGLPKQDWSLRVTWVFRHEGGE